MAHNSRFRDQCWDKTSTAPLEEAPEHIRHLQHGGYASNFVRGSPKKPKILNKDQMVKKKDNTHSLQP